MRKQLTLITFLHFIALTVWAQHGDFDAAITICHKSTYGFKQCVGEGEKADADIVPCFLNGENLGNAERNSTWLRFDIKESGNLEFVIVPQQEDDDFDFVLFLLREDTTLSVRNIVRCMAAGEKNGVNSPCMGATGLREGESDVTADAGCSHKNDNAFLAPLNAQKGEFYALLVSNMTSTQGFTIQFSGTAMLRCE